METVYCIYTDEELPASETTPEHIIPLALGGKNGFTIPVQRQFNAAVGSKLDGAIANDPTMQIVRAKHDARGHSNKPVTALWRRTKDQDGNPLQVAISKNALTVRDPKSGRCLSDAEATALTLCSQLKINPKVRIPFSAKVALGVGYFLFGEIFRTHAAHQELRAIARPLDELRKEELSDNQVTYFDPIYDHNNDRANPRHLVIEFMLRSLDCSAVVVSYAEGRLILFVGILGEWFSTITVAADVSAFPNTNGFDLGHVLILKSGGIVRLSFREAVRQLGEFLGEPRERHGTSD